MTQIVPIQISIINASTVLSDAEIRPVIDGLQQQVTNDFRPAWGVDAEPAFVPTGAEPSAGTWWLTILDDSDQAGALGYHDLTPDGLPIGKVFAGTDLKYGSNWTVTASHELLEMLADPNINLTVMVQTSDENAGRLYAYEVCDACEDDSFSYKIGDVNVSDFVFPAWFEDFRAQGSTQFDQTRKINGPLDLLKGGYIGVFDINSGNGWHQVTAEKHPLSVQSRGNVGSRRERSAAPRYEWMPSATHREIVSRAKSYRQRMQHIIARRPAA
jgi:hypothetical protein